MVKLKCVECGEPFESVRRSTRFCSDRCNKKAWRRGQHRGKVRGQLRGNDDQSAASGQEIEGRKSVAELTLAELEEHNRVDSALGQLALRLALRIDVGDDAGSAMAALSKELRATLQAATANAPKKSADPVDEVRAAREKRRAKVAGA